MLASEHPGLEIRILNTVVLYCKVYRSTCTEGAEDACMTVYTRHGTNLEDRACTSVESLEICNLKVRM